MAPRSERLAPVQHVVDNAERRLAQSVASIERRLAEADGKLIELMRYRSEYEQQFAARASGGIGVAELRDYQAFLARLNEAIRQQQAVVYRIRAERDAERARWQAAAQRAEAVGNLVERWQVEERRVADRREQREIDERAQRIRKLEL
ncbi:MAG TPA: flagellar export protein FliJ [Steroidobacteraceae bacterium]